MGVWQAPRGYWPGIVFAAICGLGVVMFVVAMFSPVGEGKVDVDRSELFKLFEPAIKRVFWISALAVIAFSAYVLYWCVRAVAG